MTRARWQARITYRSELGSIDVDHAIEELSELHDLVERGPDWNAIVEIKITLDPTRASHPVDTIEDAQRR
ncbi:MAG: hypothetical protein JO107_16290 [Hyphomicrobiales bacterium]|nr:hypothetical protein [Hyphomicrobiales bacterium]